MKTYPAKRQGLIHYVFVALICLPILIFLLDAESFVAKPHLLLPLIAPIFLLIWIYVDTSYKIEDDKFKYHSAFLRGEIEISKIREITKDKTIYAGIKPALATNGIIIRYEKYNEIYVAPENNETLIADLLKLNSAIVVNK